MIPRYWIANAVAVLTLLLAWNTFFTSHTVEGDLTQDAMDGDSVLVAKLSFGLRVPFSDEYVATWSGPLRGDLVYYHVGSGPMVLGKVLDRRPETFLIARRVGQNEPVSSGRQQDDEVSLGQIHGRRLFIYWKGDARARGPGWRPL